MSPNNRQTDNFKEKVRSNFYKMWCYYGCAIIWIIFGLYVSQTELFSNKLISKITEALSLREDSKIYKAWKSPMQLTFTCHFFNVTNPDEVMSGSNPYFNEVGPFTYDEILEKQIIDVDDAMDEITYTTKSMYSFNKDLSVKLSEHDKITILNPAYIGTMSMLSSLPAGYIEKYGNNIPKLFPNRSSIFLKANPNDLLFNGIKVSCDLRKFPELDVICKTLGSNLPQVLRKTDKQDVYLLSIFQRINATFRGPFSVNRGVNDIMRLGDITSYMGKRKQKIWNSEDCNIIRGTDSIIWAPLIKPLPFVSTFIPDLFNIPYQLSRCMCRTIEADYKDEISVRGLIGSRFVMKERTWFLNTTQCYCLLENKIPKCLPQGLIDVWECQKLPVILSEPHFLHGDPQLLKYAGGLNPDDRLHETYIIIEPYTGTPLSGQKRMQLNLYLGKQSVELLSNVSEGYFPLIWCGNRMW
ncbi:sensory neuron membrane protein 2-like [Bombus impatiens]|uniref:Sensory neuron membrane protein 2-like n=1 Tax=Bombus impatiens TaxID=132113 RepID=A0A6P8LIK4_BOMIM|nr:sensory neuron membrane protein 2-like [Bombus impatiens]